MPYPLFSAELIPISLPGSCTIPASNCIADNHTMLYRVTPGAQMRFSKTEIYHRPVAPRGALGV